MASENLRRQLESYLHKLDIEFDCVEHPEVFTVEEMMPHVSHLLGAHTKNLFLRDKKRGGLWLVTALHDRSLPLGALSKRLGLGSGSLRFTDEPAMREALGVGSGCATALALYRDSADFNAPGEPGSRPKVTLVLDAEIASEQGPYERVYCHPMSNAATLGMRTRDFMRFVRATGHEPVLVDFSDLK
ncbi:prolyl-tRNA synthetase associated domain-containing protein 1-like [Petromyzon marinus]|uniref:PrdX deacylase domain-containing protein 1 n=1 Tax=Petromyzon marinus TaxID=7757 RepID=A0AAJ7TML7_PETMA|nr:prolyl-tRNA synthetase associated domain-containing protein 1-like [Petromyzon marinus]